MRARGLIAAMAFTGGLLLVPSGRPAQAQTTDDRASALDFLLGEWRTTGRVRGGAAPPDESELVGTRLFAETGVTGVQLRTRQRPLDSPDDSDFGLTTYEALFAFVFHAASGEWRGFTINSLANRKWIEVRIEGDEVVLLHTGELFGGAEGVTRFTYFDIRRDSWQMRVDFSEDGSTWDRGTYTMSGRRVEPAPASPDGARDADRRRSRRRDPRGDQPGG